MQPFGPEDVPSPHAPRSARPSRTLRMLSGTGGVLQLAAAFVLNFSTPASVRAQEWPLEFGVSEGELVIYQPQAEEMANNIFKGRSAFSMHHEDAPEPAFGAFWFEATLDIDREDREVELVSVKVTRVKIGELTKEQEERLVEILEDELNDLDSEIDYDKFLLTLTTLEEKRASNTDINTTPPTIMFEKEPAILVVFQGEPVMQSVYGSTVVKAGNTPFFIAREEDEDEFWLDGGVRWYVTEEIFGEWEEDDDPPEDIVKARDAQIAKAGGKPAGKPAEGDERIPKIIVSTSPTELIVTEGEPAFSPIGTSASLLYMSNTEDDVFRDVPSQRYYVVLSGRWYSSAALTGPWVFVRNDSLPKSFTEIPVESEKGKVLPFIAGTPQAEEAVIDAAVPQTAAISRKDAKFTAEYDGEPQFKPIENTNMEYAVNSPHAVFKIEGRFYACNDAVWFTSATASGPWAVADSIPKSINDIPASNPHSNVKYVYVYESTPEVVYVGYTPAYVGCYPYYGTVVYGTGYYYPPYVSPTVCYPYQSTWGFHVNYNPWTGWSAGMSWSAGWASFSVNFGHTGGYWGAGGYGWRGNTGYHNRPVNVNRPVNINTGDVNVNRGSRGNQASLYRDGANRAAARPSTREARGGQRPSTGQRPATGQRPSAGTRPSTGAGVGAGAGAAAGSRPSAGTRQNNVYAGPDGNVMRQNSQGNWESRSNKSWQGSGQQQRASQSQGNRSSYNREAAARQRGASRSASSYSSGARGGGMRGGGGGRRGR